MTPGRRPVPDDVRRFVLTSIPSVPYLEAALLFRAQPALERSPADVARELYMAEPVVVPLLEALAGAGLVRRIGDGGRYGYGPRDPALAEMLDALAAAYADDLIGVTNLIHDATQKSALRFADAFKLRKEP